MKKVLLCVAFIAASFTSIAQVGIGTVTPDNSAALDIESTTKGFLLPRLTTAQRDAIVSPVAGLAVYCIDCGSGEISFFNGAIWSGSPVTTAPGAPEIGAAAAGDTQATVSYTAPGANGGSVITGYTATSSPDGFTGTLSQSGSGAITVSGLTNDTAYTFTVTATNAIGTSAASAASNSVAPSSVTSVTSSTGAIWMDRNLGATQVATSSTDAASYGDLYQWGRNTDGHEIRTSAITAGPVASGTEDINFITNVTSPFDWLSTQDDVRWNTGTEIAPVKTTNDPCPTGYRIPTETELNNERSSWTVNTSVGAINSPLKLPRAGYRHGSNGALLNVGTTGYYWSSTLGSTSARYLNFNSNNAFMHNNPRAYGLSVRCIKD